MLNFTLRRILFMLPTLLLVSVICFAVIKMQPGSYADRFLEDPRFTAESAELLKVQLGLDQPAYVQYGRWLEGVVLRGDLGRSFDEGRPVSSMIAEKLGWTVLVAFLTLLSSWVIAIPLGIYTAMHRNGFTTAVANFVGYIGLAIPDFLAALLLVTLVLVTGGTNVGGLFSPQYIDAPWSWARFIDMLAHLWIPVVAIGLEGVAGIMRQMRGNLLDVLSADYVRTARSKGLPEKVVVWKHAVRNAINPLISLAGLSLPTLISGTIIISIVLDLPTIGPMLYKSLLSLDQYVALAVLMLSSVLLLVGNLLADLALAWVDPRVRYA